MMRKSDNLTNFVSELQKSINEMKSSQGVSGRSFVNYKTSSDDQYDFSMTTTSLNKAFRLTFTQSKPDKYNIASLSLFFRVDNPDVMSNPRVSNDPPYSIQICDEMPQLGVTTWLVDCSNLDYPNSHTFYFKFYIDGTDSGTFTADLV